MPLSVAQPQAFYCRAPIPAAFLGVAGIPQSDFAPFLQGFAHSRGAHPAETLSLWGCIIPSSHWSSNLLPSIGYQEQPTSFVVLLPPSLSIGGHLF
jgi:hypothetical protein